MNMKFHVFILLVILVITSEAMHGGKTLKNRVKEKRKRRTQLEVIKRNLLSIHVSEFVPVYK